MGIVATFKPANAKARHITVGDMDLALAALARALPDWQVEYEPANGWDVMLRHYSTIRGERVVTQEMALWSRDHDDGVDIGGFDADVIDQLGRFLADRAGPQIFEDDAGSDPIRFTPRPGTKRQPAPKPVARKPAKPKRTSQCARIVPLDVLVDDLDPLARAAWLAADDLPPSRIVTVDDVTKALREQKCTLKASGKGATWRASVTKPAIELAIDGNYVTIETDLDDPFVSTFSHRLAELAGPLGLVVGDEAVAVYVPAR